MTAASAAPASVRDLVGWRMRALGLWQSLPGTPAAAGTGADRVHAVAEHLLALQGQDWAASRWALGVRTPGITEADVREAFNNGSLVRSWPMRGTIHVLPAADLGWIQAATGHKVLRGAQKRREFLGLNDASLTLMTRVAVEQLSGGRSLSRDDLGRAWSEAGISGQDGAGLGQWRYHVIWWLSQNGVIVAGPIDDGGGSGGGSGEPRFRLAAEWIRTPRWLEGEEALAELATRCARGRGPILDRDLAWWTGLGLREVRQGLAAAADAGRLVTVEIDGASYWAEPELLAGPSTPPDSDEILLLPGFDEHLLGYTERSSVLDPSHFERIVPGRNGMFRATVVDAGRVVGVWARASQARPASAQRARTPTTQIEIEPFPGRRINLRRLRASARAWGDFHGVPVEVVRSPDR